MEPSRGKAVVAVVLLFAALTVWSMTGGGKPPEMGGVGRSEMKRIEISHYKGESLEWRSEIEEAVFTADESGSYLADVNVYYGGGGLEVRSRKGYFDIRNGEIRLDGDVEGEGRGFTFESPELLYLPSENALVTTRGLIIKGGAYVITGDSGKITDSEVLEVDGDVRALFY